ncbi:hypothetical protein ASG51_00955 [Methylobacterium sp. Leaf465]|uniref:hypothetical protein n=1 Tax=Methylobacterium sp. Leaf465 TaxID=1736385 RepID=UPI0006FF94AC|nr:hypothetical protein [Methylobacterium sp. Leaf465]KQT84694.1 hypothetical protein ASG51_00955 [Methylobacterium sp. Leaf465]
MPVRLSRFYNDEGIGRGFQNIAGALAPPSADDQLAGQKALEIKEKAGRIARLFDNPNDPSFDRRATAAGLQTGSQSLEAVGMNNATARATNAADNARTIATNANTTRGSTIASLYGSLNPGQVRPMVPEEVASTIGLPSMAAAQGNAPVLSSDQLKAAIIGRLPENEQRASALHEVPVEQVQTPAGPRIAFRADSVGQAPTPPDVTGKVTNYTGPNGAKGTAVPGPGGKLFDTQTGAEVPAQSTVYNGQATGTPGEFGKTTEAQGRAAYASDMVEGATRDILTAFDTGKLPTRTDTALRSAAEALPSILSPELTTNMSPEGQVFFQNVRTALPMQLLTQSGQGVTEREYERKMAELVPVPGEAPGVTAAKRRQFATYAEAVKRLAGPAGVRPAAAPAAATPSTGAAENTVIENDAGVRMIRRGGKWEPYNG